MTRVAALQRTAFAGLESDPERRVYLADAVVHVLSVAFAIAGALTLANAALSQPNMERALALLVYGLSLILTLSLSAAYNMNRDPARVERLRACDHAGIFAMIGGTYTPLAVVALGGVSGAAVLTFIWLAAAVGAYLKLRCPRRYERCGIAAYLILGWMILPLIMPLNAALPDTGLWLLGLGCLIYTIGIGFHLATRIPYHNVDWHVFVLLGAACHLYMVVSYVAPAMLVAA